MGVPAFFRWLTRKYPSVIVPCIEERPKNIDGTDIPVDNTAPNPNGVEFDNLYLDMNGIIHPCTHPEDKPAPKNEDEMMVAIFECIDRLFRIVRPRKVLYMAIDGVAPRAKMNQQRSRRFRASKETTEKILEIERIRAELLSKGCELPPAKPSGSHFDSNCITPGTPFMDRLSKCLHYYIHDRINTDPAWKGIKVILSDANVPGEGEHKIMDYIRRQRAQPDHDPNTHHCLCGADADLIMLGLATHEPNFTIIREEFKPNQPRPCEICGQLGHDMKDCMGLEMECPADGENKVVFGCEPEFIFVRINVLREYLETELNIPNLPFTFNLERAIDDWVLMCFFVGNDFLPHLPSLEIREGAIDRLVTLYKKTVYKTGGYLTESGVVNLNRVQLILSDLGEAEDEIFRNRQNNEVRFKARMKAQKKRRFEGNSYSKPSFSPKGQFSPAPIGNRPNAIQNPRQEAYQMRVQGMHTTADGNVARSNRDAAAALKALLRIDTPDSSFNSSGSSRNTTFSSSPSPNTSVTEIHPKRKASTVFKDSDSDEEPNDEVRLYEVGFKDRYYESKFEVLATNLKFRQDVAHEYVRGLSWVLRYYYQGCASWSWYFPYHYAPFASDFMNIGDLSTEFEKATKPFEPLEQLMGVFPAASRSHVPEPWGKLMYDPHSPIIDFYPEDFQIDLNGKKFAWQGVALLPFVDEVRLKQVLINYYEDLTDEEVRRNQRGDDRLYVRREYPGYDFLAGLYENQMSPNSEITHDAKMFQGMGGTVLLSTDVIPYNGTLKSPIRGLPDVHENQATCVRFRDPKYKEGHIFPAVRLANAIDPPRVLKPGNLSAEESRNWRPMIGMTHATTRATLDVSGHRALAHAGFPSRTHGQSGQGIYNNVPPPISSSNANSRSDSYPRRSYNGVSSSSSSNYDTGPRSYQGGSRDGYNDRGSTRGGGRGQSSYNYGGRGGGGSSYTSGYSPSSNYYGSSNSGGSGGGSNYSQGGVRNSESHYGSSNSGGSGGSSNYSQGGVRNSESHYGQGSGRKGEDYYSSSGRGGGGGSHSSYSRGSSGGGGYSSSTYSPSQRGGFSFRGEHRGSGSGSTPRDNSGSSSGNGGYYTANYSNRRN